MRPKISPDQKQVSLIAAALIVDTSVFVTCKRIFYKQENINLCNKTPSSLCPLAAKLKCKALKFGTCKLNLGYFALEIGPWKSGLGNRTLEIGPWKQEYLADLYPCKSIHLEIIPLENIHPWKHNPLEYQFLAFRPLEIWALEFLPLETSVPRKFLLCGDIFFRFSL